MDDDQTLKIREQDRKIYELRCELSRNAIEAHREIQRLRIKVIDLTGFLGCACGILTALLVRHYL